MIKKVGVIGAGIWGTVMADMMAKNGYDVLLWCFEKDLPDKINERHVNDRYFAGNMLNRSVAATNDMSVCLESDIVINAIPVQYMRSVWDKVKTDSDKPFVNLSKGIEDGTMAFPVDIMYDCTGKKENIYVLSGPSFAKEVYDGCYTAVVLAGRHEKQAKNIQSILSSKNLRVYLNNDIKGVEIAGALKNVIAIGAGMVKGIGAGSNTQAAIITRGVAEIIRLGRKMGASEKTFTGLAGFGDFILTCTNDQSRNFKFGEFMAKGLTVKDSMMRAGGVVEGFNTLKSAIRLTKTYRCELPITEGLYSILFEGKDIEEIINSLMMRKLKKEWD